MRTRACALAGQIADGIAEALETAESRGAAESPNRASVLVTKLPCYTGLPGIDPEGGFFSLGQSSPPKRRAGPSRRPTSFPRCPTPFAEVTGDHVKVTVQAAGHCDDYCLITELPNY